jgi:hypothetical protein
MKVTKTIEVKKKDGKLIVYDKGIPMWRENLKDWHKSYGATKYRKYIFAYQK